MEIVLREEPHSSSAGQFRQILEQIKMEQTARTQARLHQPQTVTFSFTLPTAPSSEEASRQVQRLLQDAKEQSQIAEAEAEPDAVCLSCGTTASDESTGNSSSRLTQAQGNHTGFVLRSSVDEVDVFFAATDHGNSVMDLTPADVQVRDDSRPPERLLGFRNESQLPLRLGLVIDTSGSVKDRLSFEQRAANKFLQTVCADSRDLGFVVGVNNSVLLAQDFTPDLTLMSRAVNELAPGGGTALWDAVAFAADKLSSRPDVAPVARVLVVISDGEDNSSGISLKQAIASSLRGEVVVYTVSTRSLTDDAPSSFLGGHALRTLSELTGGAAFVPGSLRRLNGSLADARQVIRGRYLVSYKPAAFQGDGRYRTIEVTAGKNGHQFKVIARKGYYASPTQLVSAER